MLPISNCSLYATEEMLPTHCLLFSSLTHPHPFSSVLLCAEHRKISGDKPQDDYLALPAHLTGFFLLVAFLMQHLQHSIRLPWGPVQGRSLPSGAHSCSTTVPFPSFTMDFYFTYCLFPYCTLKREMLATKIKYPKIPCASHPLASLSEVCLTPHHRDLGAMLPRSLANVQNKVWSIQCNPCIFQCWKFSL